MPEEVKSRKLEKESTSSELEFLTELGSRINNFNDTKEVMAMDEVRQLIADRTSHVTEEDGTKSDSLKNNLQGTRGEKEATPEE